VFASETDRVSFPQLLYGQQHVTVHLQFDISADALEIRVV
jgi:hypothetical protein